MSQNTSSDGTPYQGTDNLEAMAAAKRYNAFLLGLIDTYAPVKGSILDFGAGVGTFAKMVSAPERDIVCVEPDAGQAELLKQAGFQTFGDLHDIAADSIDFIYSLNVIEHIEDDADAVRELLRILKPGGQVLIYVPALQVLYSSMDRKVGHFRRYDSAGLEALLSDCGFAVDRTAYADSLGYFATLAYKWFGNPDGDLNIKSLIAYDRYVFPLSRVLDLAVHRLFGKNVFALATKPDGTARPTPKIK